jgi:hypothetical protein
MSAPELSAEERAIVDRFEAAEYPLEVAAVNWRCICGSGDDGEWHSLMCAASNTPDYVWSDEP